MPHDKFFEERSTARANIASDLLAALEHLQHAHALNREFSLGLLLPGCGALRDAISRTAEAHKKETQPI